MSQEWSDGWRQPFERWATEREREPGPVPDQHLDTLSGLARWLSHPSNWVRSDIFVVVWYGLVPKISRSYAWKLAPEAIERHGRGLLESIMWDRQRRQASSGSAGE